MEYIVYLLTIALPVKQRTVSRLADVRVSAGQVTIASGAQNDRTVGAPNPRLHLSPLLLMYDYVMHPWSFIV